jgi:anti-anti-sigma factor
VDVSKVDTVQTAMLSHLVYAARRLDKRNSKVILVGASESLIDMLRMCRLENVIHVEGNSASNEFAESL